MAQPSIVRCHGPDDHEMAAGLTGLYLSTDHARCKITPPMPPLSFHTVMADALCYMQFLRLGAVSDSAARSFTYQELANGIRKVIFAEKGCAHHHFREDNKKDRVAIIKLATHFIQSLERCQVGGSCRLSRPNGQTPATASAEGDSKQKTRAHEQRFERSGKKKTEGERAPAGESNAAVVLKKATTPLAGVHPCVAPQTKGMDGCTASRPHGTCEEGTMAEQEHRIDQALKKIVLWADEWLLGISKGEDWYTFEDCLNQPDI